MPEASGSVAATAVRSETEEVVLVGGNAVLDVERPAAEPPPLCEQGAVAAAGRHLDLGEETLERFFTLMKMLSIMPVIPEASVIKVRPAIRSGRPTRAPSRRSKTRSSIGSTWYFTASARKIFCSSASFAGFFAATFAARLKSERRS